MLRFGGLDEGRLRRVRMERGPIGPVRLDDYSGVILGGGPFNVTEPEKSEVQQRVEAEVAGLLDEVVARDFPFLGACYGIGTLGTHQGAVIDRHHSEPVGPMTIRLTAAAADDPLFGHLPETFDAYLGHKEAVRRLPAHAVNLASSATCPVQAFRVGQNVYATQFHPELDLPGIETRIDVYKNAGYFPPEEAATLIDRARERTVVHPMTILAAFVERYARTAPARSTLTPA